MRSAIVLLFLTDPFACVDLVEACLLALIILYLEIEAAVAWMIHQAYLVDLSPCPGIFF